jgi:hypothetical protein
MSRLLDLPSELRQKILLLALPSYITVCKAAFSPLANLHLICKLVNEDVLELLKHYAPIYVVTDPTHLPYLQHVKRLSRVKLDLFSTCTIHDLREHVFPPWVAPTLPNLINQWSAEVVHLPRSALKDWIVDVSPVPEYGREKGPRWISLLVNDSRVSNRLFNNNEHLIASLLDIIGTCLGDSDKAGQKQGVTLKVEGYLSRKSAVRIPHVLEVLERLPKQGIRIHFEPNHLDEEDCDRMVNSLAAVPLGLGPELQNAWKKLRHEVRYALQEQKALRQLFIKNEVKDAAWTMFSTQRLVLLAMDQLPEHETKVEPEGEVKSVTFESLEPLQRAWLHQIAKVLDLQTISSGERENGNVIVKSLKVLKCNRLVWMRICKRENVYVSNLVESLSNCVEEDSRVSS